MRRLYYWIGLVGLLGGAGLAHAIDPTAATTRYVLMPDVPPAFEMDVQKNDAETPIVAPVDYFRDGEDFLIKSTAALNSQNGCWVKVVHEWVEPITAPNGTAPSVAADQMILVEVHGGVTVTVPGKGPAPATEGQEFPAGSTVATDDQGTVAVFIGGINSVRLGPSSTASINYQVVGPFRITGVDKPIQRRTTVVKLETGRAFSKIGYEAQVQQYFELATAKVRVIASSGDFLTVLNKESVEVGVARGTVRLTDPKGTDITSVTATAQTGLQIMRLPEVKGQLAIMTANSNFLATTLAFVEKTNQKVTALRERHVKGTVLTPQERTYLERLPTFAFLQRVRKS